MAFIQVNNKLLGITLLTVVIACQNEDQTTQLKVAGQKYYYESCLSCHSFGENALHKPSLSDMSKFHRNDLLPQIEKARKDSVHLQLIPENYNIDSLTTFILSYEKNKSIP
jgi:hypothetical protein